MYQDESLWWSGSRRLYPLFCLCFTVIFTLFYMANFACRHEEANNICSRVTQLLHNNMTCTVFQNLKLRKYLFAKVLVYSTCTDFFFELNTVDLFCCLIAVKGLMHVYRIWKARWILIIKKSVITNLDQGMKLKLSVTWFEKISKLSLCIFSKKLTVREL